MACDRSFRRLQVLKELLARHVPRDVCWHVVQQDAARPLALGVKFDRILLDAPCSGTGTLSRNPEIKLRLRAADLGRFAEKQARMLENALDLLAPAGRLVYATCSLEPEEDEFVVESVLEGRQALPTVSAARLASEFPVLSDLFDQRGYLRTRPDLHAMDGFFAAVIEDKSEIRN